MPYPIARVVLLALFSVVALTACESSKKGEAVQATIGVISQSYGKLNESALQLHGKTTALCKTPNQGALANSRAAWADTMDAWMHIQPISFGPVRSLDMIYRIQFWPDPRDMAGQETEKLIAQPAADDAAMRKQLQLAGVAAHGLPAIEVLLYPSSKKPLELFEDSARCQVLQAITSNLQTNTAELAASWTTPDSGYASKMRGFGADGAEYADADAALSAILGSMIQSLEVIEGSKLGWPLGVRADNVPQPFRVESRRSRRSLENIAANLAGLETLFTAGPGYGLDDYLRTKKNGAPLANNVLHDLREAQTQARSLQPLFPALQEGGDLAPYRELLKRIHVLAELLGNDVASKFGVNSGLNFNDGD